MKSGKQSKNCLRPSIAPLNYRVFSPVAAQTSTAQFLDRQPRATGECEAKSVIIDLWHLCRLRRLGKSVGKQILMLFSENKFLRKLSSKKVKFRSFQTLNS